MPRPATRQKVDFPVILAMHDRSGAVRQVPARCTDLSDAGIQIETRDPLELRTTVLLSSVQFGRIGHASVRYCRRSGMKYVVGLQFNVQSRLADPARGKMLALGKPPIDPYK